MAQPVYKLFQLTFKEAWYQLSAAEQNAMLEKLSKAIETVGGRSFLLCTSAWSSEQWAFWGVEEYPNVEAVQKLSQIHNDMNWYRYVESYSVLGTKWPE